MRILLVLGFLFIILLEVPTLVSAQHRKELRAFWVLLAVAFVFSYAMVQRWPVPNPTTFIEAAFRPLSDALGLQ